MSLEWARARLLQHCEQLRKLCEAQVAERARLAARQQRAPRAVVLTLRPAAAHRPAVHVEEKGKVLQFVPPAGQRRA